MSLDGQSLANVKNRIGKSQLHAELYRIDREKKAEMRMHNTSKQRFRAKYSKLDYYSDRGKDAADVRMYETHNPGFCYRRNGECRIPQTSSPTPKVDFMDIHSLLFTDGEVDIEKVLCLHLLSAHRTETLTPPAKYHRSLSFLTKEQSPLERLIERSRKRRQDDSLTKLLPTYILDVKKRKQGEEPEKEEKDEIVIQDGRLAERVIINDKIAQLVHTVMEALQDSNPEKMKLLLKMSKEPDALNQIVEKPHIQEFLKSLSGQMLVSSCEAFHLTQPFKATTVPLQLETSTNSLRNLVKQIRKNVLQFPDQSTWKNLYHESQNRGTSNASSFEVKEVQHKHSKKSRDTTSTTSKDTRTNSDVQDPHRTNFIQKNKQTVSKYKSNSTTARPRDASKLPKNRGAKSAPLKRKFPDQASRSSSINSKMRSSGSRTSKNETFIRSFSSSSSSLDTEERIIRNINFLKANDFSPPASMWSKETELTKKVEKREEQKSIAKHIPGLKKKENSPPNPKTPRKKALTLDQVSTGSIEKLSKLIDQEIKKLNLEEKRFSKNPRKSATSNPGNPYKARSKRPPRTVDTVTLDVIDLARIGQEIKENETQKKLQKFLEKTI